MFQKDLTKGPVFQTMCAFALPMILGNLLQQGYNLVDTWVVGRFVGPGALAAVGASGPILNLLLVLFMGISVGASIMVSQYYGAGERDNLSETVGTTITATLVSSIFIMVLGPLITRPVMALLDTPADIYEMSCTYLVILFAGIIGCAYYNIISGILRGLGDSIMPLIFLIVACVLNIILDIWFVAGFQMGVAGVAWATIIAQAVSGALCLWRLMRMKDVLTVNLHTLRPKGLFVKKLVQDTLRGQVDGSYTTESALEYMETEINKHIDTLLSQAG